MPGINDELANLELSQRALDDVAGSKLARVRPKGRWKWNVMAQEVGMSDEYDFIYDYSSRLLHATPASLTTDQPALEDMEVYILVRYCAVKMRDIISAGQGRLNVSTHH